MIAYYRTYALAWEAGLEEDRRLRDFLKKSALAALVLTIVLSLLPVPEFDRDEAEAVPPRFAKLLLDKPKPPPPPPLVQQEPEPEAVKKEPEKVAEKPEPTPEPRPAPPVDRTEEARKKVAGLLPFADGLAELRDNQAVAAVSNDRQLAGAAGAAARAERALITSKAGQASGGINTAGMSRDTGGAGLAGRETTTVSSSVAGLAAGGGSGVERSGDSGRPARSREEIEMVFDQNKGAIYALYNRALRRDPTLQGKLVLRLTIEPSGLVSACEIVSSELADDELQRKLVQRVKLFRFLAKEVETITTTKPIDFFPA